MPQSTKNTPMMEQYNSIKKQYPDAFLFYRIGDFYEMFYDDAIKGSQLLELTLTARNKSATDPIPMCGVPHHAVQNYIDILVDQGYKVAICEQVEDPRLAKGMVKREVIQLITPGTKIDESASEAKENNYLTALHFNDNSYGFAYVDLSTGEIQSSTLKSLDTVVNEMSSLRTKEVVIDDTISPNMIEVLQKLRVLISNQNDVEVKSEFSYITQDLKNQSEIQVVEHLLMYLEITQKRSLAHLKKAIHYETSQFLKIDRYAQNNLELIQNSRTKKKSGTLLWLLDNTKTAMGGRLLKQWITRPLIDKKKILERQDIVANLLEHFFERSSLQEELTRVYDLERLAGRVAFGNVNGRDLIQLKTSLEHVPQIRYFIEQLNDGGCYDELFDKLTPIEDVTDLIDQAIVDDPPISITDGGLIKSGYNSRLDEYIDALNNGKSWLAKLEQEEKEKTGISNLKIKYNKVFGYYIEVTRSNMDKVPDRYQRKQTLKGAERFITPELKEIETKLLTAQEQSTNLQYEIFVDIREQIKDHIKEIQTLATAVATLDVLQSFATISENERFVKPTYDENNKQLDIKDGWHPVVQKVLGKQSYVPNDVSMSKDKYILLITGPNMSGKSTYMRQLALTVIMSQVGCFVPAKEATLPIFDQIFTRIGAADDLISGESTFMVEMKEANEALMNATENSLILFDEIGRGTSTYDGMALAQAIIEYIHNNVKAKTLFSTHYHELTDLSEQLPHLENIHVGAVEENGELIFLHKVKSGAADKSYGVHVAKLAGMPSSLLKRANVILDKLENAEQRPTISTVNETKEEVYQVKSVSEQSDEQLSLFKIEDNSESKLSNKEKKTINEIKSTNLMSLTPLEVMNVVYKWQKNLGR